MKPDRRREPPSTITAAPPPTLSPAKVVERQVSISPGQTALLAARERASAAERAITAAVREQAAAMAAERDAQALVDSEQRRAHAEAQDAAVESAAEKGTPVSRFRISGGPGFIAQTGMDGRVTRICPVSMGGFMAQIVLGQIVTLQAYGRDGLERLRARGIVLEPIL